MFVSRRTFTTVYAHPHGTAPRCASPASLPVTCHSSCLVVEHQHDPESRIANVSRPSSGEDAATNNIGSVTLLHDRVRVQAESEEAGLIPSQFSTTS